MDHRNKVIESVVRGKSFLDVGGLWGTVNEKITVAHAAGARTLSMLDIWPADSEWWVKFRSHCDERGITGVKEFLGSIDNPEILKRVGVHDVVHCSGVLYHCPNPFLSIRALSNLSGQHLLIAVAVMPSRVENEFGAVDLNDDRAICVPCMDEYEAKIFGKYLTDRYGGGAWGINDPVDAWFFGDGSPNYGPWWWLWTAGYFGRLLKAAGFRITESYSQFDGTGHLYVCEKSPDASQNYGVF